MKQLIKISNQSAKILGIYAECKICRFNSNNKLLHKDLFQSIFLTDMQHQITHKRIKAQQRMNYFVFLSF